MSSLLALVPVVGPFLAAAWSFVTSPIGRFVAAGALAFAVGFWQGWSLNERLDRSAAHRAEIAALQKSLAVNRAAAERADARAGELAAANFANEEKLRDLQLALQASPGAPVCVLGPDGERRLRDIR